MKEYPLPLGYNLVVHKECGKPAFYYSGVPGNRTANLRAEHSLLMNGVVPKDGDQVFCGSCGRKVYTNEMEWVIPRMSH